MKKLMSAILLLCLLSVTLTACSSVPYTKGTVTETGFESEFIGIRFTTPEGYVLSGEEEVTQQMQQGAEAFDLDEDIADAAKKTTVYEMMAATPLENPKVLVMVEKAGNSFISVDRYLNNLEKQLADVDGVAYTFADGLETVEVAGQTYKKSSCTVTLNGQTLHQSYIFRKIGDRMVGFITACSEDKLDELDALMRAFEPF